MRLNILMVLSLISLTACRYNMDHMMRDPHFASYQERTDDLERNYLQKKISYPDYQEQKKRLDDQYEWDIKQREQKIRE